MTSEDPAALSPTDDPSDVRSGRSGGWRVHRMAAEGFDRAAVVYERSRPSYPADAVALIVRQLDLRSGRRVLDLAAGTGKLTRQLVPSAASVVAVEPLSAMRDQLRAAVPGVDVVDGTAEHLPLADGSVDAVVCAQAWHWFDGPRALAEVRRVLRPGGGLAVVFNIRDDSVAWVRRVTEISDFDSARRPHHQQSRAAFAGEVAADGGYGAVAVASFRHAQVLDEAGLVERVASQSNVATMGDAERHRVLGEIRDLVRSDPELAGRTTFALPYDTEVAMCHRR